MSSRLWVLRSCDWSPAMLFTMRSVLLASLLLAFASLSRGQFCFGRPFCEDCLEVNGCGWCDTGLPGAPGTCTTKSLCLFGTFRTNISECNTCVPPPASNVCNLANITSIVGMFSLHCQTANNFSPGDPTDECSGDKDGWECTFAIASLLCTGLCGQCDLNLLNVTTGQPYGPCPDMCTNVINKCPNLLAAGCLNDFIHECADSSDACTPPVPIIPSNIPGAPTITTSTTSNTGATTTNTGSNTNTEISSEEDSGAAVVIPAVVFLMVAYFF